MTEAEVHVALVCASTDDGTPLKAGGYKFSIDGGLLQVADDA